jgi:hypothetical protein
MNILKFEIKRGFTSRAFLISLILSSLLCSADFYCYYRVSHGNIDLSTVIQAWIGTDYMFAYNVVFYLLLPIIGCLPYAASYFEDLNSGYIKNICVKTSRKAYYFAKSIAVFLTAAVAVMLPLTVDFIVWMMIYPLRIPEPLLFLGSTGDACLFASTYYDSSLKYAIIFILVDGLAAGVLALLSVCISELTESSFITITAPFAIYVAESYVFGNYMDAKKNYSIQDLINPLQQTYGYKGILFTLLGLIFLVEIVWIALKARRKDIL